MNEEALQLIEAIRSLKAENDPLKDYALPFAIALFSSMLGAFVAYMTITRQEKVSHDKYKVHAANNWLLEAEGAMQSLIALKQNYHEKLSAHPIQRALVTRAFIHKTKLIDVDVPGLSFIIPKKDDKAALNDKWRNLHRIRAILENYNFVIELWGKRSDIGRPLIEKIVKENSDMAHAEITQEQIFKSVPAADFITLIDLTEKAINFTDKFIIELHDFISSFPRITTTLINKKAQKQYGLIQSYDSLSVILYYST